MKAKRSIIKINALKYHKAAKKLKSAILNDLVETTHLHRKYLTVLLNNTGKVCYNLQGVRFIADPTITYIHNRGRKKTYTQELIPYLKTLWELTGFRSSIHLVTFIKANQTLLYEKPFDFEELAKETQTKVIKLLSASTETKAKLLKISSATVDRLLRPVKEKYRTKGLCPFESPSSDFKNGENEGLPLILAHKYKPHPHASIIKKNIPVESYFDKPKHGPLGYTEIDLVHHCGSIAEGSFCYTLNETEINTGWTELRALRNKARVWTLEALADIDKSVPFKIHTRYVDNGSEFINNSFISLYPTRKHEIYPFA